MDSCDEPEITGDHYLWVEDLMDWDEERPKHEGPPRSCLEGESIKIVIGSDDPSIFYVHRQLLCHYSSFFKKALCGKFAEASSDTINLEEDDPKTFAIVRDWLYSGNDALGQISYRATCEIWVFADKYGMPVMQNHIINEIFSRRNVDTRSKWLRHLASCVNFIVETTMPNSKLRDVVFDSLITMTRRGKTFYDGFNADAMAVLVQRYQKYVTDRRHLQPKEPSRHSIDWCDVSIVELCRGGSSLEGLCAKNIPSVFANIAGEITRSRL
ncbi:MAG: hypothetical protein M1828_000740 [Chrysothrix sp. TS-e1954]|nr:MAG: hypothetical protein M1828_000740 [Chrysothrix sp. TS-e1954]